MRLRKLSGSCEDNECPTVYVSDRGTLVIQGDQVVTADGLMLHSGEQAVEISVELVTEALRALG
jgi:hypothetical protein